MHEFGKIIVVYQSKLVGRGLLSKGFILTVKCVEKPGILSQLILRGVRSWGWRSICLGQTTSFEMGETEVWEGQH